MVLTNQMINTINAEVHTAEAALDAALAAHQAIPARLPLAAGQPRPAGPRHRDQTDPPRHPHRRVQHRAIARPCDRHRHRLHPRRLRSPHPDPHRSRPLRRHHPRPRHPAHPARPAARAPTYRRHRRQYGINRHTVAKHLKRDGITVRGAQRKLTPDLIEQAAQHYTSGESLVEVGALPGRRSLDYPQSTQKSRREDARHARPGALT